MRRFIKYCICYFFICAFALLAFEVYLLYVPNRYSYKYEYVKTHKDDIRVLLMGNCHIEYSLDPELIGNNTFNFAISGREVPYDVELAKYFIPNMKNLKVVVMTFDYRSFAFGRGQVNPRELKSDDEIEGTYKCMYYKYMGVRIDPFWYWSEILNSELNYKARIGFSYAMQIETDTLGFARRTGLKRIKDWEYLSLPKIIDTSISRDLKKYKELYTDYQTLARLAKVNDVRLILVSTPMYKTYWKDMNPEVEKEMNMFIAKLQSEFPTVEYYNFMHSKEFVSDDFFDASHISDNGIVKFSNMLKKIIEGGKH
jgi:hypothetical protein